MLIISLVRLHEIISKYTEIFITICNQNKTIDNFLECVTTEIKA